MKKQIMGLLAVVSMMLMSATISAATVIWEPVDVVDPINSSLITFDFGVGITDVAIFDDSDTALANELLQFNAGFAEVLFTQSGTDWVISSSNDLLGNTSAITSSAILTDSDNFIVAVSDDNGTNWTGNLTFVQDANSTDLYYLTFTDITLGNNLVIMTDVQPVPVPAALWLFGSAMFGMVAVGRRKLTGKESVA